MQVDVKEEQVWMIEIYVTKKTFNLVKLFIKKISYNFLEAFSILNIIYKYKKPHR